MAAIPKRALVLVVERNALIQRLETYLFEQAGFEVQFANDGLAALESARSLCPSLVVTEILVPKLDGLRLCRELRSDQATRQIRLLVVSALDAERRALDAGADRFVGKPLNEERLLAAVECLLSAQQQEER